MLTDHITLDPLSSMHVTAFLVLWACSIVCDVLGMVHEAHRPPLVRRPWCAEHATGRCWHLLYPLRAPAQWAQSGALPPPPACSGLPAGCAQHVGRHLCKREALVENSVVSMVDDKSISISEVKGSLKCPGRSTSVLLSTMLSILGATLQPGGNRPPGGFAQLAALSCHRRSTARRL